MAKGDDARSRNRIDSEGERGKQLGTNLREGTLLPNVNMFKDYYTDAANKASTDYATLMPQYQEFAKTGGFSPQDVSNIRARAVSPIRGIYSNAQRNVERQRSLQGGYSPGFGTLQGRMARESSSAISDATTNAEAAIAQLVQQGKLAGLSGASNLYGTAPGAASTFGNQVLGASGQLAGAVGNEMGFGTDLARLQIAASQIPGKWENTVGRIGDVLDIGQKVGGMVYPWLNPGGAAKTPGFYDT